MNSRKRFHIDTLVASLFRTMRNRLTIDSCDTLDHSQYAPSSITYLFARKKLLRILNGVFLLNIRNGRDSSQCTKESI